MSTVAQLSARLRGELAQTFRSLRLPNFRTYSAGQLVSMTGTWAQAMALSWITYELTDSALMLGLVALCTNLPVLCLSLFGGMVADRYDRRRVIICTQWAAMINAGILTALVLSGNLQVWMIMVLAATAGIATAFESPSRQAFVADLVRGQDMMNAISINSVIFNSTRIIGPAIGAVILAQFGAGICFALNTASFVAAIWTLHSLKLGPPRKKDNTENSAAISEGLRVAFGTAEIRAVLVLTFFTSFFGFQFAALLPVFVSDVFHASASALGFLAAASAVGALGASLMLASRGKPAQLHRNICVASIGLAVTLFLFAISRDLWLTALIEVGIGVFISTQLNCTNSLLQLRITDAIRGRVMSIYTMIMLGAVPFGSVVIGYLADHIGAPWAVAICAFACAGSAIYFVTHGRKEINNG